MKIDALTITLFILILITTIILTNLIMSPTARNIMILATLFILAQVIFYIYRVTKL